MSSLVKNSVAVMMLFLGGCTDTNLAQDFNASAENKAKIVGGTEVPEGGDALSPYIALIYGEKADGNSFICTGTFVSSTAILTAAHCVGEDPETMLVSKGHEPLTSGDDFLDVKSTKIHEKYTAGAQDARNDIALIFLKEPATGIKIATLDDYFGFTEGDLFAYGYGRTDGLEDSENAYEDLGTLRKATLREERLSIYDPTLLEYDQSNGVGLCYGDSGGPLLRADGRIVGIASGVVAGDDADDACRNKSYYTRVVSYQDWITANLSP